VPNGNDQHHVAIMLPNDDSTRSEKDADDITIDISVKQKEHRPPVDTPADGANAAARVRMLGG
jgi:hypothetical protein